jgi:tetratricopeptide (TPR) repeat protein
MQFSQSSSERMQEMLTEHPRFGPAAVQQLAAMLDPEPLSDAQLVAKLKQFGISINKENFRALCEKTVFAQEISDHFMESIPEQCYETVLDRDWPWLCVRALWGRWFPDLPCYDVIAEKLYLCQDLMAKGDYNRVCAVWDVLWLDLKALMEKSKVASSLPAFEERFEFVHYFSVYLADYLLALWLKGEQSPEYLHKRISFCREILELWGKDCEDYVCEAGAWTLALAVSLFTLGKLDEAAVYFEQLHEKEPQLDEFWFEHARCFIYGPKKYRDFGQAIEILRRGLANYEQPHYCMLAQLAEVLEANGEIEEANKIKEIVAAKKFKVKLSAPAKFVKSRDLDCPAVLQNFSPDGPKIGRKEPCPCGSGKKYKRCCGSG